MKMMNAFVESLIQEREKEYRREVRMGIRPGSDFSDHVSRSLSGDLDDKSFTNIQVRVLEDNPKSMVSAKRRLPTTISDDLQDPLPNPTSNKAHTRLQQNPPPPPERSYSPRIRSKREKKGTNKKEAKDSVNESNVQRWGGGSDDTSPTTMPKCPKRTSLSPTRRPESLPDRQSLASMATRIVASGVGAVDPTSAGCVRRTKEVSLQ